MCVRSILLILLFLVSPYGWAQSITTGDSTSFYLGAKSSFFAGGNTTFKGSLLNNGTIVSYSDIDFVDNTDLGDLKFVGTSDQTLSGKAVTVQNMVLEKEGKLVLMSERMTIEGSFDAMKGEMEAEDDGELLFTGSSAIADQGFVTGNMVGFINPQGARFPMGLNGFANYITLSGTSLGEVVKVECKVPETSRLVPTEDMVGIADEVEWVLTTQGDSVEVSASAVFNGIDLTSFSNGKSIRAQDYTPSLVILHPGDSVYQDLGALSIDNTDEETFGSIVAEKTFFISSEPTYIAVALLPKLVTPEFFIPNAFAPNGQLEENRVFKPYFAGAPITSVQFQVWDSFQNSLYSVSRAGTNVDLSVIGWDGKLGTGQVADDGVYYFAISLTAGGRKYEKTGSFLLAN